MDDQSKFCGGTTRAGNGCKLRAGHRTEHVGFGKCYLHGGKSKGAPGGNTNAVVTGAYQRLTYSALSPEEQSMWDGVPTDPRTQSEHDLKLVCIRIHRMLLKIQRYEEAGQENDGFLISSISSEQGFSKTKVDLTTTEYHSKEDAILRLEEAITRTSVLKVRVIEQLRNILKDNPPESGGLDAIVEAIDRSAEAAVKAEMVRVDLETATEGL